jgi:hypothetical protein
MLENFYQGVTNPILRGVVSLPDEKLEQFLKSGKDWERRATTVPGVFILKLPGDGRRPASLAVELNPVDELGKPTKKRGLVLRSSSELQEFRKLINNDKLTILMGRIDEVNPRSNMARKKGAGGEEVFEI